MHYCCCLTFLHVLIICHYTPSVAEGSANIHTKMDRDVDGRGREHADASAYTFNATMRTTLDNIVAFYHAYHARSVASSGEWQIIETINI